MSLNEIERLVKSNGYGFRVFDSENKKALHQGYCDLNSIRDEVSLKFFLKTIAKQKGATEVVLRYGRKNGRKYHMSNSYKVNLAGAPSKPTIQTENKTDMPEQAENLQSHSAMQTMLEGIHAKNRAEFIEKENNKLVAENQILRTKYESLETENKKLEKENDKLDRKNERLKERIADFDKPSPLDKVIEKLAENPQETLSGLGAIMGRKNSNQLNGTDSEAPNEFAKGLIEFCMIPDQAPAHELLYNLLFAMTEEAHDGNRDKAIGFSEDCKKLLVEYGLIKNSENAGD